MTRMFAYMGILNRVWLIWFDTIFFSRLRRCSLIFPLFLLLLSYFVCFVFGCSVDHMKRFNRFSSSTSLSFMFTWYVCELGHSIIKMHIHENMSLVRRIVLLCNLNMCARAIHACCLCAEYQSVQSRYRARRHREIRSNVCVPSQFSHD